MDIDDALRQIVREEVQAALRPLIDALQGGEKLLTLPASIDASASILTVAEAAAVSRRHPETIRLALQSGALRGAQRTKGGSWRILRSDLEAWAVAE